MFIKSKSYFLLGGLLAVSPVNADILSVHCPLGCPGNPESNDLIFGHIYALSNNPKTKLADWVAYEVNPVNYGVSPGRDWGKEPLLDDRETLEVADYKGANRSQLQADRGHQAPLASFAGSRYWYEANYLSNITPQDKDLNQGPWKALEESIRHSATYEHPLFAITGPLYTKTMPSLPNADEAHTVPSGYYKLVYDQSGGIAFLMQQSSNRKDNFCSKIVDVSAIRNHVTYSLPKMPTSHSVKARLGC